MRSAALYVVLACWGLTSLASMQAVRCSMGQACSTEQAHNMELVFLIFLIFQAMESVKHWPASQATCVRVVALLIPTMGFNTVVPSRR